MVPNDVPPPPACCFSASSDLSSGPVPSVSGRTLREEGREGGETRRGGGALEGEEGKRQEERNAEEVGRGRGVKGKKKRSGEDVSEKVEGGRESWRNGEGRREWSRRHLTPVSGGRKAAQSSHQPGHEGGGGSWRWGWAGWP